VTDDEGEGAGECITCGSIGCSWIPLFLVFTSSASRIDKWMLVSLLDSSADAISSTNRSIASRLRRRSPAAVVAMTVD
jgi:hypothetical protein